MRDITLIIDKIGEVFSLWFFEELLELIGISVAFISTYQTETPSPFVASSLYRGSCLS
jgi:hypothetical protein